MRDVPKLLFAWMSILLDTQYLIIDYKIWNTLYLNLQ